MRSVAIKFLYKLLVIIGLVTYAKFGFAQCGSGKGEVYIEINTKNYANEIYWKVVNPITNATIDSTIAGVYTKNNSQYIDTLCLDLNTTYRFEAWDKWGDGWDGGTYSIKFGNKTLITNSGKTPDNGKNANGTPEKEVDENFNTNVDTLPDLALIEILSPIINTCKNKQFTVSAKIQVVDSNLVDTVSFQYKVDNGVWKAEEFVFKPGLGKDSTVIITFSSSTTSNFVGSHRLHVKVEAARDDNVSNDTLSSVFINDSAKTTFPITVDFDAAASCGTGSSTCIANGSCNLGTIWMNMPGDDLDWSLGSGETNSLGTGPDNDHTQGNSNGKYLFLESSGCQGGEAFLQLNCAQLNKMSNPYLEFWYHMYGDKMGKLFIDIDTNGTWLTVDSLVGEQQDSISASWALKRINLANYKTTSNLRVRGVVGAGFTSDMAVDDISVKDISQKNVVTQRLIMPADSACGDSNMTISVVVANEGITPATGFTVLLFNNPNTIVFSTKQYKDTLQFGETDTVHFTGINSYSGVHTFFLSRVFYAPGVYSDFYSAKRYFKFPEPQNVGDTGRCGVGSIDVTTSARSGERVNWYSDRKGNNLLGSGDTLQTGILTKTTYLYHKTVSILGGCSTEMDSILLLINSGISTQLQEVTPSGYRAGSNSVVTPDSLIQGDTAYHLITVPSGKTLAQYGTTWDVQVSTQVSGGTTLLDSTWKASGTQRPIHQFWAQGGTGNHQYALKYTIRDLITGCDTQMTKYIYVIPKPNTDFTATDVCEGNATTFTDETTIASGSISSYKWYFGDGDSSTAQNPTHTYSSAGVFKVVLRTTSNLNVVDEDTIDVTVGELPDANFIVNDVCENETAQLINRSSISSGTLAYLWSDGASFTASTNNIFPVYSTSGIYSFKLVATSNVGCKDSITKTLSVNELPTAGFSVNNVCMSDSARFNDTSQLSTSVVWSFGNGETSTASDPVYKYDSAATYTISQVVNTSAGCSDTATQQIQVHPMPNLVLTTNNKCVYDSVVVIDSSTNTKNYQWLWGNGDTTKSIQGIYKYNTADTYSIIANVTSENNCAASDTLSVKVHNAPTADFTADAVCEDDTTLFSNQSSISKGFISSKWTFGNGDSSNVISPRIVYDSAYSYSVKLTTTSIQGCSDSVRKSVVVNPNPKAKFNAQGTCTSDTTEFKNVSIGASSYKWFFDNGDSSFVASPNYVYNSSGNYDVKLIATSNKGCTDNITKTTTIYQAPDAVFATGNECLGDSVEIENYSTNVVKQTWAFGDASSSTLKAPSKLYSNSGNYIIQLNVTGAGNCTDSTTRNVTVYASPIADFSANNECLYDTISFNNKSSAAISHLWSFGNGLSSTAISPEYKYTKSGTYAVKLVVTSLTNCKDSISKNISAYAIPVASFNANTSICQFDTLNIANSSLKADSAVWAFGNGDTVVSTLPKYAYKKGGTYSVKLKTFTKNGCADSATAPVVVNAKPVVSFSQSAVCDGENSLYQNNSSIVKGSLTYAWDFNNGKGSSTKANPSFNYNSSGVYPVKLVTNSNNGCSDSLTKNDTVFALPIPAFSAKNVCLNDTMTFANKSSNSQTYVWHFGDGSTSTDANPKHLYAAAGNYTVKLISTNAEGCVDSITKTKTIYTLPVAGISVSSNCLNDSTRFSNASSNAVSYAWTFGDGNNSKIKNPAHVYNSIGSKSVQLIATSGNGCLDSNQTSITIYSLPVASFSANDTCLNDTTYFSNTSNNAVSYSWDFDNSSASTQKNPSLKYAIKGNYRVQLIATSNRTCKDTIVKTVKVFAIPSVSFTQVSSICQYDSFSITNTTTGAGSYLWTFGNGDSSIAATPKIAYPLHGNYTITQRAGNAKGCFINNTASIIINPDPQVAFNANGVCNGQTMQFSNQSKVATGTLTYSWFFGDGMGSSASKTPSYTYGSDGNYNIKLVATSDKGCQDSVTNTDTVYALPKPSFTAKAQCLNDTTIFINSSSNSISRVWHFGDGNTSTDANPKHLYAAAGNYSAKLISTNAEGCVDSTTETITVYSLPAASISVSNNCLNDSTRFSNNSSNAVSYAWTLGDGNNSTYKNPVHVYSSIGSKTVHLIATSGNGCLDTTQTSISIYSLPVASFMANDTCLNDSTFFNNTSQNATSYTWDFGNNTASIKANPIIKYAVDRSYNTRLIATTTNGCKDTATNVVKVYPNPTVSFNMVSSICQFDSFSIKNNTTGAISYLWTFNNGDSSTTTSPEKAYKNHGTYYVVQDAKSSFGCRTVDSTSITIHPKAVAAFEADNVCYLDTMSFSNKTTIATGSVTNAWDFGDGYGTSIVKNPIYAFSKNGVYNVKLVVTSNEGCVDSVSMNDTVYALPIPKFSAQAECKNDSSAFVNTSTNSATYAWYFGDGNNSRLNAPKYVYDTAGNYTAKLIATSPKGCIDSTTNRITVYSLPVSGFSVSNNCLNDTTHFNNTSTNAVSYAWTLGDGNSSTKATPDHLYSSTGSKSIQLIATSSNGCLDTVQTSITIYTLPVASFLGNDTCFKDTIFFRNTSQNATGYEWDFGDNTSSTKENPAAKYAKHKDYDVRLIATTGNGCKDTVTNVLKIYPHPTVNFNMVNGICQYDSFSITNNSTGASSYLWTFGNGDSSTITSPDMAYDKHGSYYVIVDAQSSFGCNTVDSALINIHPKPKASFASNNVCLTKTMSFANSSTVATGSFKNAWTFGDSNTDTTRSPKHNYSKPGIYTAQLVVTTDKSCVDSIAQTNTVYSLPAPNFITKAVCQNDTTIFDNTSSNAVSYVWYFGDGTSSTQFAPKYVYANAGTYSATLVATSSNGCVDSITKTITVYSLPVARFTVDNNCLNDTTSFSNKSTNAVGYSWSYGNGDSSKSASPALVYQKPGVKTVELITTSSNGCLDTVAKALTIYSLPVANFSFNDTCLNNTTQFINQSQNSTQYKWNFDNGSGSTNSSPNLVFANSGVYDVQLISISQNNCLDTINEDVEVYDLPVAAMAINDTCLNAATEFKNYSTNATNYKWEYDLLLDTNARSFNHIYKASGSYGIKLIAWSKNACVDTLIDTIQVFRNPNAKFNVNDVCLGDTAKFRNRSTNTKTVVWSFGNGQKSTSINPMHYYFKSGTYATELIAMSAEGCTDTSKKVLEIKAVPKLSFAVDTSICQFSPLGITNNTTGASGFKWSFGTDTLSTDSVPSISLRKIGTKWVKLIATSSSSCQLTDSIRIRVKATPRVGFGINDVCLGDTTSYINQSKIDDGKMRFSWDFGDKLGYSANKNPSYVLGNAGSYTAKLIVQSTEGCTDSSSRANTIYALPALSFNTDTVCLADSTTITNTSTNAVSYTWKLGKVSKSLASPKFLISSSGTHLLSMSGVSVNGCTDSLTRTAIVNALPKAQFTAQDVCLGNTIDFGNQSLGASSYEWKFGNGSTSSQFEPIVNYSQANTYTVQLKTLTDKGCTDSLQKTVFVSSLPIAQFSAHDTCLGDSVYFKNLSASNAKNEWAFGDGKGSFDSIPTHLFVNSGSYLAQLVVTNTFGCTDTAKSTIRVFQNPEAQFAVSNVCLHDSAKFSNQSTRAATYSWFFGDGTTSGQRTQAKKYTTSGNYDVKLIVGSVNGCLDSINQNLTIHSIPTAQFSSSSVCLYDTTSFSNNSINASSYNWSFGNGTSSSSMNPTIYYGVTGSYNITMVALDSNGCSDTSFTTLDVWRVPTAQFSIGGACVEDSVSFINASTSKAAARWSFGDGNTSKNDNPKHQYSNADTFKVKLVVANSFGCKDSISRDHKVVRTPKANFLLGQACEKIGYAFKNTTNTFGEEQNYRWDFGDSAKSKKAMPIHTYAHSGTYNVKLVAEHSFGCKDSITKTMDARPTPIARFKSDPIMCVDRPVKLVATTLTSNIDHQWVIDGDTILGDSITYTFNERGDWNISLTAAAPGGCVNSLNQAIEIGELPLARFVGQLEACQGESIDFLDLSTVNGREDLTYKWYFGKNDSAFVQDPIYAFDKEGTYKVRQFVSTETGCIDSTSREIIIHRSPNLNITVEDVGAFVYFHPGDTVLDDYYWDFGNAKTSRFATPRNWYDENGTYFVELRGITDQGCEAKTDTIITLLNTSVMDIVEEKVEVYPNPFKDDFKIEFSGLKDKSLEVVIINQQGQLMLTRTIGSVLDTETIQISTVLWPSGVYQVQLIDGSGDVRVLRVVKE